MKINVVSIFIVLLALTSCVNNSTSKRNKNMDTLNLTQEWDVSLSGLAFFPCQDCFLVP